jgi:hypothetical protein
MRVERSRIHVLMGSVALAVSLASRRLTPAAPPGLPDVTVYKTPT